jgi:hypothetical protein
MDLAVIREHRPDDVVQLPIGIPLPWSGGGQKNRGVPPIAYPVRHSPTRPSFA